MLDQILLDKVAYDTDIPELTLRASAKWLDYWYDYLASCDDRWRLVDVIDYTLELAYDGEFGEGIWE